MQDTGGVAYALEGPQLRHHTLGNSFLFHKLKRNLMIEIRVTTLAVALFTSYLVSWCLKRSQPQRIISGLRESFIEV